MLSIKKLKEQENEEKRENFINQAQLKETPLESKNITKKKKKKISIYLPMNVYKQLYETSQKEERSINQMIKLIIRNYFDNTTV